MKKRFYDRSGNFVRKIPRVLQRRTFRAIKLASWRATSGASATAADSRKWKRLHTYTYARTRAHAHAHTHKTGRRSFPIIVNLRGEPVFHTRLTLLGTRCIMHTVAQDRKMIMTIKKEGDIQALIFNERFVIISMVNRINNPHGQWKREK